MLLVVPAVTVRPHSPALTPFVSCLRYQESEIPAAFERMLPTGQTHLLVNLYEDEFREYGAAGGGVARRVHGAVLAGSRSQATVIDTKEQRRLVRVDFKLGGAAAFFNLPLSEAHDQFVELDQLWGRDGAVLRERLLEACTPEAKLQALEAVLLEHLARSAKSDPALPVAARRFHSRVGLGPKRFARVRRLQRVLRSMTAEHPVDWAALAAGHGYTDQAHLIHDFRALTGISPSSYRPSFSERNHVRIEPPAR